MKAVRHSLYAQVAGEFGNTYGECAAGGARTVFEALEAVLGVGLGRPCNWFGRASPLCLLELEDLRLKGLQGVVGEFAAST